MKYWKIIRISNKIFKKVLDISNKIGYIIIK